MSRKTPIGRVRSRVRGFDSRDSAKASPGSFGVRVVPDDRVLADLGDLDDLDVAVGACG